MASIRLTPDTSPSKSTSTATAPPTATAPTTATATGTGTATGTASASATATVTATPPAAPAAPSGGGTWGEWDPVTESVQPVRGKHRIVKPRFNGGGFARSSTVLGVGVMAAVSATGMANAQEAPPVPALSSVAEEIPGVGALITGGSNSSNGSTASGTGKDAGAKGQQTAEELAASAPFTSAGVTVADAANGATNAGEALRSRILEQAEQQAAAAEAADKAAADAAEAKAKATQAAETARKAEAARKTAEAAAKAAAEAKAAQERIAKLAKEYTLPTSGFTITATFGQAGSYWSSGQHTGLDFAAPTGTPAKAVHGGVIKSAAWSGSYGYRIILELPDGTEIWYCHLSSMTVTSGTVTTGEVIGRVGATGNVTGPHLHMEVHPGGGTGIDPAAWLRGVGISI